MIYVRNKINNSIFNFIIFTLYFVLGIKNEKPYFEEIHPRNISTAIDDTAILKCVVKNKGNRTVRIL